MTNDDPEYVLDLERALVDAEKEIKHLYECIGELEAEMTGYRNEEFARSIAHAERHSCGCCCEAEVIK